LNPVNGKAIEAPTLSWTERSEHDSVTQHLNYTRCFATA